MDKKNQIYQKAKKIVHEKKKILAQKAKEEGYEGVNFEKI